MVTWICSSWGFFGHQLIAKMAVFTLPPPMNRFYKHNLTFLCDHSSDPDKRRYVDPEEGSRHFLDVECYENGVIDSIPQKWKEAVARYGEDSLKLYGTVPWQIEKTYYLLVKAFAARDSLRILHLSANLSHYISDAHVPLHATVNYNGQLTHQEGIHSLWESRLPELFSNRYNLIVGKAYYIENPLKEAWRIVKKARQYTQSVLQTEARLSATFATDKKYGYSEKNGRITRQYSETYSQAYHSALKGMVEEQMRSAILETGSFWYSAWVDAGQPELSNFKKSTDHKELEEEPNMEKMIKKGKILGRKDL